MIDIVVGLMFVSLLHASAQVSPPPPSFEFHIAEYQPAAAVKLFAATVDHAGRPIAIVVDGQVISAPLVHGPVASRIKIDGTFTREEAEGVVRELNKHLIRKKPDHLAVDAAA
jgi:preprotein translocase subunit SecD